MDASSFFANILQRSCPQNLEIKYVNDRPLFVSSLIKYFRNQWRFCWQGQYRFYIKELRVIFLLSFVLDVLSIIINLVFLFLSCLFFPVFLFLSLVFFSSGILEYNFAVILLAIRNICFFSIFFINKNRLIDKDSKWYEIFDFFKLYSLARSFQKSNSEIKRHNEDVILCRAFWGDYKINYYVDLIEIFDLQNRFFCALNNENNNWVIDMKSKNCNIFVDKLEKLFNLYIKHPSDINGLELNIKNSFCKVFAENLGNKNDNLKEKTCDKCLFVPEDVYFLNLEKELS